MKRSPALRATRLARIQAGVGLIELMIAIVLGIVVSAAILSLLFSVRASSLAQASLAQTQDDQRLGLVLPTSVIQNAGYFPATLTKTSSAAIEFQPYSTLFPNAGQSIGGVNGPAASGGDTLYVRYETGPNDSLDCNGNSNPTAGNAIANNQLSVDASGNLDCLVVWTVGGAPVATSTAAIAGGLASMTVLYGVLTPATGSTPSTYQYLPASAMTPAGWAHVVSTQVTLNYKNPLSSGQLLPPVVQAVASLGNL